MKKFLSTVIALMLSSSVYGLTLKVGVLAPDGTSWAKSLKEMAKQIKKQTNGAVKIKMYLGGTLGDEPDVLRKIRIGQVHGGLFTGKTLGDINGDVRVMEIPFTFNSDRKKAGSVLNMLTPELSKKLESSGFENLGFFKIGFVYFASVKKVTGIDNLKDLKIWAWEGDPIVETMIEQMNLNSIPLPLPDVLSSLTTGIVDAAYASAMGIIALQWNSKVKYVVDFPIAYSIGAFLVDKKKWNKIKPNHQALVKQISKKYIAKMNEDTRRENEEALKVMQSMGIKLIKFAESDIKKGEGIRKGIIKKLKGKLISADVIKKVNKQLGLK